MTPLTSTPKVYRRRRVHVLNDEQHLEELDLWPGDEVLDEKLNLVGKVNDDGNFVTHVSLS